MSFEKYNHLYNHHDNQDMDTLINHTPSRLLLPPGNPLQAASPPATTLLLVIADEWCLSQHLIQMESQAHTLFFCFCSLLSIRITFREEKEGILWFERTFKAREVKGYFKSLTGIANGDQRGGAGKEVCEPSMT